MEVERRAADYEWPEYHGRICGLAGRPPSAPLRRTEPGATVLAQDHSGWTPAFPFGNTPESESKLPADPGNVMEWLFRLSLGATQRHAAIHSWSYFSGRLCVVEKYRCRLLRGQQQRQSQQRGKPLWVPSKFEPWRCRLGCSPPPRPQRCLGFAEPINPNGCPAIFAFGLGNGRNLHSAEWHAFQCDNLCRPGRHHDRHRQWGWSETRFQSSAGLLDQPSQSGPSGQLHQLTVLLIPGGRHVRQTLGATRCALRDWQTLIF